MGRCSNDLLEGQVSGYIAYTHQVRDSGETANSEFRVCPDQDTLKPSGRDVGRNPLQPTMSQAQDRDPETAPPFRNPDGNQALVRSNLAQTP